MISCNTQFGKLKSVVVGKESEVTKRPMDMTFLHVYNEDFYDRLDIKEGKYDSYTIPKEILDTRNEQLDNLANMLRKLGVEVHRPEQLNQNSSIKTPTYETANITTGNVRDISLIYRDTIVETPLCLRSRVFENLGLYDTFSKHFDHGRGGKWIKAPNTQLNERTYNLIVDWEKTSHSKNQNEDLQMSIDAPNFLTIGKDVIVNVATESQHLGFEWVRSLFPESRFHVIKCTEAHLDGEFMCLRPGVFLANRRFVPFIKHLPQKFQNWKFLVPEDLTPNIDVSKYTDIGLRLSSSSGMDINVLSIDEKTVLVSKRAEGVRRMLETNGFDVIEVELDYGEIFSGGIHCSTLDIIRDDEYEFYI